MSRPQEPHRPFFPFGNPFRLRSFSSNQRLHLLSKHFEETLSRSLKNLNNAGDFLSFSWMRLAIESLSEIHAEVRILIAKLDLPISEWDDHWIEVYLDNSMKLLDICNTFTSEISRLSQAQLSLQFALHSLTIANPNQFVRATASLDVWRNHISSKNPRLETCSAILDSLKISLHIPKVKNLKGKILMRAMYGVIASTIFVCGVLVSAFSGSAEKMIELEVSDVFVWREAYKNLQGRVSEEIWGRRSMVREVVAVDRTVKDLYPVVQLGNGELFGGLEVKLREGADVLSKELGLLGGEVDGFFGIILGSRDALLTNVKEREPSDCVGQKIDNGW